MNPLLDLTCHPAHPASPRLSVRAGVKQSADGNLQLTYCITTPSGALKIPPPVAPGFADELWQHTCCEAFIAPASGRAYREFNFSPSGAWAVYDFSDYRQRRSWALPAQGLQVTATARADGLMLSVTLPSTWLPAADAWRIGLTVVLETTDGDKSWWALTHTAAQPDFHPLASFTLALNRPAP